MIYVNPSISLNEDDLVFNFIRSSGPGGQAVNKQSTAVQLRFDVAASAALSDEIKRRLTRLAGSRLTREGELVIEAKRFRGQAANRRDAIERLVSLIRAAAEPPKPRIRRRGPSQGAKEQRLRLKHHRGDIKKKRRSPVRGAED